MEFGSIGLGVQSTAMALKAINGEIKPCPEAFIFADTRWERDGTYENLKILKARSQAAGIPFFVVNNGDIRADALHPTKRAPSLPYRIVGGRIITVKEQFETLIKSFEKQAKQETVLSFEKWDEKKQAVKEFWRRVSTGEIQEYFHKGTDGLMLRQCTYDYKIAPTLHKVREIGKEHGIKFSTKNPATLWIGFSIDEVQRMSPPNRKYIKHRFPLIEERISRDMCEKYLIEQGYPVPCRSSCIGCPFHTNEEWRNLSDAEMANVEDFERRVNEIGIKRKNKEPLAIGRIRLHRLLELIETQPYLKNEAQGELDLKDQTCGAGCFL